MTDDDTHTSPWHGADDKDEPTIKELDEKMDAWERTNLPTDRLEEQRDEKVERAELAQEVADIERRLDGTGDNLRPAAREELEQRRDEIYEVLEAPVREEIADLEEAADIIERRADRAEERWGEDHAERMRERAAEKRREANALEADLDSTGTEAMSAGRDGPTPSEVLFGDGDDVGEDRGPVDVDEALDALNVDRSDLDTELDQLRERAETFEAAGWEGMAASTQAEASIVEAARADRETVEIDDSSARSTLAVNHGV